MEEAILYNPVEYTEAPKVLPPCDDLLPWHETKLKRQNVEEAEKELEEKRLAEKNEQKGFFTKITEALYGAKDKVVNQSEKLVASGFEMLEQRSFEKSLARFRKFFHYEESEQLWSESYGFLLTEDGEMSVNCFVSTNYLSFIHENKEKKQLVHISLPFSTIVSIQRGQTISTGRKDVTDVRVTDENNKDWDSIMIYDQDKNLHILHRIYQKASKSLFNIIDKCWRASHMHQPTFSSQVPGEAPKSPYDSILKGSVTRINNSKLVSESDNNNFELNYINQITPFTDCCTEKNKECSRKKKCEEDKTCCDLVDYTNPQTAFKELNKKFDELNSKIENEPNQLQLSHEDLNQQLSNNVTPSEYEVGKPSNENQTRIFNPSSSKPSASTFNESNSKNLEVFVTDKLGNTSKSN